MSKAIDFSLLQLYGMNTGNYTAVQFYLVFVPVSGSWTEYQCFANSSSCTYHNLKQLSLIKSCPDFRHSQISSLCVGGRNGHLQAKVLKHEILPT